MNVETGTLTALQCGQPGFFLKDLVVGFFFCSRPGHVWEVMGPLEVWKHGCPISSVALGHMDGGVWGRR